MKDQDSEPVSIILPIYNEGEGLENTVKELRKINRVSNNQFEFILIDDGSTDQTGSILKKVKDPNFRIITHNQNQGYGASLKTGIQESKYETIVITDADNTYPNQRIFDLLEIFFANHCDMVVGARTGLVVKIPLSRRPAKWLLNRLAAYLTGIKIPDLNSGFRVMKKKSIEKFLPILPDDFSFTTTITLAMLSNKYKVMYKPIDYYKREGQSKIRPFRDTLNFLRLIIRTILYFDPLKIFLPMSLFLFCIGFLFLLYRIFIEKSFVTTIIILFIASFQILTIGMLADLIVKRMRE